METFPLISDRIKFIKLPEVLQFDSQSSPAAPGVFWPCLYFAQQSEYFPHTKSVLEYLADSKYARTIEKKITVDHLKTVVCHHDKNLISMEAPIAVLIGPPCKVTEQQRVFFSPDKSMVVDFDVRKSFPLMKEDCGKEIVEQLLKILHLFDDDLTKIDVVNYEPPPTKNEESQTGTDNEEASFSDSEQQCGSKDEDSEYSIRGETVLTMRAETDDAESERGSQVITPPVKDCSTTQDDESNLPKACNQVGFTTPYAKDRSDTNKEVDTMPEKNEGVLERTTQQGFDRTPNAKLKSVTPTTRGPCMFRFPSRGKPQHSQFRNVKGALMKLGCVFRENLYCRPGCDPQLNPSAEKGKDYFETETDFRNDLCRFGIEDNGSPNEEEKEMVHQWIRFAIIRSVNLKCRLPNDREISAPRSMRLLKKAGLGYKTNDTCNVYFFPGVNYKEPDAEGTFEFDKDLKEYLARYGIPDSLNVEKLTPEEHFSLELHLAEWLDEDFTL